MKELTTNSGLLFKNSVVVLLQELSGKNDLVTVLRSFKVSDRAIYCRRTSTNSSLMASWWNYVWTASESTLVISMLVALPVQMMYYHDRGPRRIAGHVCYSKVIFGWSSIYRSSTEDPSSVQALLINSDRQRKAGILVIMFYICRIEILISDLLEQIRMKVEWMPPKGFPSLGEQDMLLWSPASTDLIVWIPKCHT